MSSQSCPINPWRTGTVIVDKAGVVRYVEYVSEVTEEPDDDQAIKAARALLDET